MKLNLVIAARAKPEELAYVIAECDRNIADTNNTMISVALDHDDDSLNQRTAPETRCELLWNVAPREDSLGAKYSRAASLSPADLYVLGADDNAFITEGWDEKIRSRQALFPDSLGLVYFGRLDGTLPVNMAIPHALLEVQGFLFPPYWPTWWHDTWTDEIAHMTGRHLWAEIAVEEIGGRGQTRGLRDVVFWAKLFEATRPEREQTAMRLNQLYNAKFPWRLAQLEQALPLMRAFFSNRTQRLRDPATAGQYEKRMSHDAPADERYMRIKAQAEAKLAGLMGTEQAA